MYKFEHIHLLSPVHLLFCFVICKVEVMVGVHGHCATNYLE